MKIKIIIPYYGKFPNYFQLFLDSCSKNREFNWLIFTNDKTKFRYSDNITFVYNEFEDCQKIIKSKFNFNITIHSPKKLCDYKCAYGYIFDSYIKDADFWGYCDVDIIFGKLNHFITEDLLNCYDKIFSLGHLTLYRNTPEINKVFMNRINGKERYKEVFQTIEGCAFDEWYPENINEIFLQTNFRLKLDNLCADIESYKTRFILNSYNLRKNKYEHIDCRNMIFEYVDGSLFQVVKFKNKLLKKEYPYVHLQKRKMNVKINMDNYSGFYIIPNKFISLDKNINLLFIVNNILNIFNYQYFKVKYKSLKEKLKIKAIKLKKKEYL